MAGLRARLLRLLERVGEAGISPGLVARNLSVSRRTATRLIGDLATEGAIYRPTPKGRIYAAGMASKVRERQVKHAATRNAGAATRTRPGSSPYPPPRARSGTRAAPQLPALPLTPGQRADAWIETVRSPAGQYGLIAFGTLSSGVVTRLIAGPEAAREVVTRGLRAAEAVAVLKSVPGEVRPDQLQTMVDQILAGETLEPTAGPTAATEKSVEAGEVLDPELADQLEARRRTRLIIDTVRQAAQEFQGLGQFHRDLVDLRSGGGPAEQQARVLVSMRCLRWMPGTIPGFTGVLVPGDSFPGGRDQDRIYHEQEIPHVLEGLISLLESRLHESRRRLLEDLRTTTQLGIPPEAVLGSNWTLLGIRKVELRPPALESSR